MASNLTSRKPLFYACALALLLFSAFATALILNEDLRRYTIAQIEEFTNDEGKQVKKVKIEKPEPNEKQVREISHNQERKKREELKEKARELRETIYEIDEVVEAQKKIKEDKADSWDELADASEQLAQQAQEMQQALASDDAPVSAAPAEPQSEVLAENTQQYAELLSQLAEEAVTMGDVQQAVTQAKNITEQANVLEEKLTESRKQIQASEAAQPTTEGETAPEESQELTDLKALEQQAKKLAQQAREHYRQVEEFSRNPQALQSKVAEAKPADPGQDQTATNEDAAPLPPEESQITASELAELNNELSDGEISALGNELPSDETLEAMSTAELYEQIQELTGIVDESFAEGQAAEMANRKGIPLEQALDQVYKPETPTGPDLGEALSQNNPSTREEFQQFNQALESATSAAQQMSRAANNRKSALMGDTPPSPNNSDNPSGAELQASLQQRNQLGAQMRMMASNQGRPAGNVQDMRALMAQNYQLTQASGSGVGFTEAEAIDRTFQTEMGVSNLPATARLDTNRVLSQAVPGRRLDMKSERQGWIFLDTWYVIGPWQRPNSRNSFDVEFPPETLVDLDATYDGKVSRYTKQPMELKWRFVQTENIRINPPDEISDAVYYGYTEVFCEAETEVTIAVASDDMAKLWINDLVVFEDNGLSPWRMDEGFRTILLKPGYNTVLIRLENGPSICYFSVLMCPTEALR